MSYELNEECRPFIDSFYVLKEYYGTSAFHDSTLYNLQYQLSEDGLSSDIVLTLSYGNNPEISLHFVKVHGIEMNIADIRSAFFFSIDFYVTNWCDYGQCIVMESDGDYIKIVAEKILVS